MNNVEHILNISKKLSISDKHVELYGNYKAKIDLNIWDEITHCNDGKLILVTSINPTTAGEGKTTTSIGLADAMSHLGHKVCLALREPSMGPCFGIKGGATGGGKSKVFPEEDINMHFNGDLHAITSSHNLLASIIDNHIYYGNNLQFDLKRISWNRVLDLNDRSLRNIVIGLGNKTDGITRESGFDITVTSEIMAALCLSYDLDDLSNRLNKMIVGYNTKGGDIRCGQLNITNALKILLKNVIKPNLVQTLYGTPALIHGGPFANIAHGCNSVIATKCALKLADYVITEAGFGADLGAEKFLDIKCPILGKYPDVVVIVTTIRAIKLHATNKSGSKEDDISLGFANLHRHIKNLQRYNLQIIVALNIFSDDSPEEINLIKDLCENLYVKFSASNTWEKGPEGGIELGKAVLEKLKSETPQINRLYEAENSITEKINKIATKIYGGRGVTYSPKASKIIKYIEQSVEFKSYPVCIAKTQYSFSDNKNLLGAPEDFEINIKDAKIMAGAGFVVAYAGDIVTMPGLPAHPIAEMRVFN